MAYALVAIAIAMQWHGAPSVMFLSAFALIIVATDQLEGQRGGRVLAPLLGIVLLPVVLIRLNTSLRTEPAFLGAWSVALYAYAAGLALAAALWTDQDDAGAESPRGRALLRALCGAALFVGGTRELSAFFAGTNRGGPSLAGDLSISVYWLIFAGTVVALGFLRDSRRMRQVGLAIAGLAAAKIALRDLSRLEALYRVASFFVLSLIALAVAYGYNRRLGSAARESAGART